jgi:signal transduction histidine kinase
VEEGIWCRIEAESMETVFRNLLENAILYSMGAPRIRINLHREGETAHLRIADCGRGIEKKEQKKVFRMFYRVRHAGGTIRGSGLGLFIIRTIVRMHRGHIWVESAGLNQGTTFHIGLPLSHSGAPEEPT